MNTAITITEPRELAHRFSGGIEVTLYWDAGDDSVSVQVLQAATGESLTFPVARGEALDAFYHPFAHLDASSDDVALALESA